jgi:hypothetical protein
VGGTGRGKGCNVLRIPLKNAVLIVPPLHVGCVGSQIRPVLVELVIKVGVYVLGLQIGYEKDRGHGSGKLSERVKNVLSLQSNTLSEFFAVNLGGGPHRGRILPWAGRLRMKRACGRTLWGKCCISRCGSFLEKLKNICHKSRISPPGETPFQ